jgi:hypothetical protein
MGYNARNDEIRDNVTRMRADWKAQRQALVTVRRFSATLSANGYVWFWPKVAARGDDQTPLTGDCRRQLPHGCGPRPWEERIDEPATN